MKRLMITLCVPLCLMFVGCDTEPEAEQDLASSELEVADLDASERAEKKHRRNPAEKVCGVVSCTDEQKAEVEALFAQHRPHKDKAAGEHKRERPDMGPANATLADAFASASFSADDLAAHRETMKNSHDKLRGNKKGELLTALHGLLTPEQRGLLADKMAERGPGFLHGKHGKHGKRGKHGKHGKHGKWNNDNEQNAHGEQGDQAKEGHKMRKHGGFGIGRMCKVAECSDEQREQLKGLFADKGSKGDWQQAKADKQAAHKTFADAFRGDSFGQQDLDNLHGLHTDMMDEHLKRMDAMAVQVHGLLTPEQRGKVAEKIREHGPHALMGGKRGKHGKHGKRHGKRGDGPCEGKGKAEQPVEEAVI